MNAPASEAELAASARAAVTIGRSADELRRLWLDPETQSRIWTHFADVTPGDDRVANWIARGPAGGEYRWRTEVTASGSHEIHWSSLDGADVPNTGSLILRPAPGNRDTELHLAVRYEPPGGMVGEAVSKLFHIVPGEILHKALYKLRALALTGEIPATEPQPAVRYGGVDR
jgi:uncharacterized membrane protein